MRVIVQNDGKVVAVGLGGNYRSTVAVASVETRFRTRRAQIVEEFPWAQFPT